MTPEDFLKKYGTQYKFHKETGMSHTSLGLWIKQGYVPESSQVHRCKSKIFDRNSDGDFNITDKSDLQMLSLLIRNLYSLPNNIPKFCSLINCSK